MNKRFDDLEKKTDERFNKVDGDIRYIHGWLSAVDRELGEIKSRLNNIVYRYDFESVMARLDSLEKEIGARKWNDRERIYDLGFVTKERFFGCRLFVL